jgi:hypothetical protein
MALLIIIVCAMAFVHFIYDGILAPSFRLWLNGEFRDIKASIRALRSEISTVPADDWVRLERWIGFIGGNMGRFELSVIYQAERSLTPEERKETEEDNPLRALESTSDPRAAIVRRRILRDTVLIIAINNGGLLMYALPIVALAVAGLFISSVCKRTARRIVRRVVGIPPGRMGSTGGLSGTLTAS